MLLRNLDLVLREFHLNSLSMIRILSSTYGSILSGSSVLQAYLGEQWDSPSDLDIYIPYDANSNLKDKYVANAIEESVSSNFSNFYHPKKIFFPKFYIVNTNGLSNY